MDNVLKYTDNNKFIRWVLSPTDELDLFWGNYLNNNPKEVEYVEAARLIVGQLESNQKGLSKGEADVLFDHIMKGVDEKKTQAPIIKIGSLVAKYAALFVLLFGLGVVLNNIRNHSGFNYKAEKLFVESTTDYQEIILTINDGKEIPIPGRNGRIQFLNNSRVVVNNTDTITYDSKGEGLHKVIVPLGKIAEVKLIDGTKVFLNADSQFIFTSDPKGRKRETYLSGEAFFDVTHNEKQPFVVKTLSVAVEVLGTKFNVSAYPVDDIVETYLVEGKVRIVENGNLLHSKEKTIAPSQRAVFDKDLDELSVSDVANPEYVTWYKGYLSFKSTELSSILIMLERYYNIDIKLSEPEIGNKLISGKLFLQDESEDTVIKVLANTASLQVVKQNENNYVIK